MTEEINAQGLPIFDTHAHYDDSAYVADLITQIASMRQNGVCGAINCGVNYNSSKACITLAEQHAGFYAAVGVHPEDLYSDEPLDKGLLLSLTKHEKVVAIGEIGLDYHWNNFPKETQKQWFFEQLDLAQQAKLPVIVHDREAHGDTLELLKQTKPQGVLHCFSGSCEMAEEVLKLGMYIGVGGVVTFKNARKTVEVVKMLPLSRLLLETDAPYLSPEPFRGKRCRSDYIYYTAQKIAEIKDIPLETVLQTANQNAKDLFSKIML